jgi:hypothetical protein
VAPTTWRMQNADGYGRLIEIRMYMEEARVYIPMWEQRTNIFYNDRHPCLS